MPYYRKKRSRTSRRRRRGRRYRRYRRKKEFTIRRMPNLLPDALVVKLKYTTEFTPADFSGVFLGFYPMNSPASNQPMGWDQWSAFYGRYLCYKSSISMQFVVNSNTVEPMRVVLFPSRTPIPTSLLATASQTPYAKSTYINGPGQNTRTCRLYHKMGPGKLDGQKLYSVNYASTTPSGTPSNIRYWNYLGSAEDGVVDEIHCYVTIWYHIKFFERNSLEIS